MIARPIDRRGRLLSPVFITGAVERIERIEQGRLVQAIV
jgi:hypothetical protein